MSVIALAADIAGDQAAALLPQLRRQIEAQTNGTVVLDGASVQRFDSASLALLLECRRMAEGRQLRLQVQQLPAGMLSMAHVYGVDGLLGLPAAPVLAVDDLV